MNNSVDAKMSFVCQHCNRSFTQKQSMVYHQKNAQYCLRIQRANIGEDTSLAKKICEFCRKIYSSEKSKKKHQLNCIAKIRDDYENIIIDLRQKSKEDCNRIQKLEFDLKKAKQSNSYLKSKLKKYSTKNKISKKKNKILKEENTSKNY